MAGQAYRRVASREERELQDVERAMEEELVERVIHLRLEQADGQQQLKYLVKVCICVCVCVCVCLCVCVCACSLTM